MAISHPSPLARIHALYTLDGLDGIDKDLLIQALADSIPGIRENAIKLAEPNPALAGYLPPLLDDPSPQVALQALLSIGAIPDFPDKTRLLAKVAIQRLGDEWFRLAILCGLSNAAAAQSLKTSLDQQPGFWRDSTEAKREFLKTVNSLLEVE